FEQRLVRHLRQVLKDLGVRAVEALPGRIRVQLREDAPWDPVRDRLARTFGIATFFSAQSVPLPEKDPLAPLKTAVAEAVRDRAFDTFRVRTKRGDKRFPLTSMEVDRAIGAHVCQVTGKRVNLTQPDLTLYLELLHRDAFVAVDRYVGPGGLPVGISGRVACLISGGIDSPVAAYRMMQRGCRTVFVHFHGQPFVSRASEEKVRDLVELLTRHQLYSRLYFVPFGEIQREIVIGAPAAYRVVLYRRMMMRIAEELARKERCWAMVTGDSLGQVASQTPQNLTTVQEVAQLPILRPLIGMDKIEITQQAERIGTFETSIEPDQDCCRLFVPPHPSTRARVDQIRRIEQSLDIGTLVKQGLERASLEEFTFPSR
ncbi:MAG: tRNA uracil 4-sulfurtransferase ThiI, partial [Nitrospirales bacterium]